MLYKFKKFDLKTCKSYQILGFRTFSGFPEATKLQFQRQKKLVLLLTRYLLHSPPGIGIKDTNTNAKEEEKNSGSIQKRASKLVLLPPEWKKGRGFSVFAKFTLIDRPSVVRAVLQTALSLIQSLTEPFFVKISSKYGLFQTERAKDLLKKCSPPSMSRFTCNMSRVTFHMTAKGWRQLKS